MITLTGKYRSFATRVSQLKIWHFWVIGIARNACRCIFNRYSVITGDRSSTNRKVAGSIPGCVSGFFIDIKFFRSHYAPGVDSASNRNEYHEYFLGGKCGRCVRLITLPPSCAVITKSGSLNFMEPSGPAQACNGTALPLPYSVITQFAILLSSFQS